MVALFHTSVFLSMRMQLCNITHLHSFKFNPLNAQLNFSSSVCPIKDSNTEPWSVTQHKAKLGQVLKKKWKNKTMHGQYTQNTDTQLISEEGTFLWLMKGDLNAETESDIVAALNQSLQTKYYTKKKNIEHRYR
jgi:hypothetical protein